MASEAELIIDRRRLKRRLTFWRVVSVLLFIGGLLALASAFGGFDLEKQGDHIARVRIKYAEVGRPASTKAALVARALQDRLIDLDDL